MYKALARKAEFHRDDNAAYPGHVMELTTTETAQIYNIFKPLFRDNDVTHMGRLRKTTATDNGTQNSLIHTDHKTIQILIYLELPPVDLSEQGTFFYEHSYLKEKKIPANATSAKVHTYDILFSDENFHSWKCWNKIEPRVNRAVIFDGNLFHSGPPHILGDESSPRLTLEFSFLKKDLLAHYPAKT